MGPLSSANPADPNSIVSTVLTYVVAYLYWGATTVLAGVLAYAGREAMLMLIVWAMLPGHEATQSELFYINLEARALDSSLFLIYGAALILATVTFEAMFRRWAFLPDLKQRFVAVAALEAIGTGAFALLALLIDLRVNGFKWASLYEPLLAFTWMAFVVYQWRAFHRLPERDKGVLYFSDRLIP